MYNATYEARPETGASHPPSGGCRRICTFPMVDALVALSRNTILAVPPAPPRAIFDPFCGVDRRIFPRGTVRPPHTSFPEPFVCHARLHADHQYSYCRAFL